MKCRACAPLGDLGLQELVRSMTCAEFVSGDVVVQAGDVGTMFFVVEDGELTVVERDGGVVGSISKGDIFGEASMLQDSTRTSTITATRSTVVWTASGRFFRSVVKRHARLTYYENRGLLNTVAVFENLSMEQKDCIGECLVAEKYQPGMTVVTEGQAAVALFFVKSGTLSVYTGGTMDDGTLTGGSLQSKLEAGDCWAERGLLVGNPQRCTVVAATACELLFVSMSQLEDALGDDLRSCLERNLVVSSLKKSPIMSHFSAAQLRSIVRNVSFISLKPHEEIAEKLHFVSVIEGSISGAVGGGTRVARSGEYLAGAQTLAEGVQKVRASMQSRLGVLREEGFERAFDSLGLTEVSTAEQAETHARMMAATKHIHLLRHLSSEQVHRLVKSMVVQRYRRGAEVVLQGHAGSALFLIASGEVRVFIDGVCIRTMGKNAYFGERALLQPEPRTASITVSSCEAELWVVSRVTFERIATDALRESLLSRIALQDTKVSLRDLRIRQTIGAGSAGVVRLVQHRQTRARYALKRILKSHGEIPQEVRQECLVLKDVDHPFVMKLVRTFESESSVYVLTELITGGELWAALREIPHALTRTQAQFYTGSLLLVLHELADRNIVYRDLKPENAMLDHQGYIKLIDFGIAKKLEEGVRRTFTLVGTPHYMAPEMMQGRGYGVAVDIWSLGVMLFEFVCGFLPFGEEAEIPNDVCAAVMNDAIVFPDVYCDTQGRELIELLLCRDPRRRLGTGPNGYDEIRAAPFFQVPGKQDGCIFDRILNRELEPPFMPSSDIFPDPESVRDTFPGDDDAFDH